eukprot:TRINITY_DN3387_c0_g2_i3.p1 TRINITY_DN3387_c0_g2~~TRINITY_DN3387_c0_g2_i3.p1  ORF type:complete len:106 (+),score=21.63 TRINITY_DN3387_c0_g2_i3:100-417(+)
MGVFAPEIDAEAAAVQKYFVDSNDDIQEETSDIRPEATSDASLPPSSDLRRQSELAATESALKEWQNSFKTQTGRRPTLSEMQNDAQSSQLLSKITRLKKKKGRF